MSEVLGSVGSVPISIRVKKEQHICIGFCIFLYTRAFVFVCGCGVCKCESDTNGKDQAVGWGGITPGLMQ